MSDIVSNDFPIAKDAYVAFDGLTIKEKIRQRLNQTGIFTDQNFEGSNISAINDVFGMVFSLLLYNLNKSINEGRLTNAQLYENVNRIVKEIDYKPIGHQSANLSFSLSAINFNAGVYTIPKYSNIKSGGINYSFKDDISFTKSTNSTLEIINAVGENHLLYQGTFIEYPTINPIGSNNEIIYLTTNDNILIDHFCLDVYIYRNNSWEKWNRTSSLYLNNANDSVYEMRFNENKRYELKFGNDINGKKLQSTDLVAIYYLKSDGTEGEVGANVLNGKKLNIFNSLQFSSIIKNNALMTNYIDNSLVSNLLFNNSCGSTYYSEPESVDSIRQNAPANFRSQYSLTTAKSYETFIQSNFSSIIQDVKVKNNTEFLDTYIKYYYNLGLTQPQLESRALFNQLKFSDSCNFNNVYIFTVPKTVKNALGYVNSAQKELMISTMKEEKTLTAELIVMDPVYLALDIAISDGTSISFNNINTSNIYIQKNYNSRRNDSSIITEVNQIIQDYFARKNINLGQTIDLVYLQNLILGIDGVKKISTIDTLTNARVDGLKFIMWNPIIGDISLENLNGSKTLEDFQFPYLFSNSFINRIFVETGTSSVETIAA